MAVGVDDVRPNAIAPGQVLATGIVMQGAQIGGEGLGFLQRCGIAAVDHALGAAAEHGRDLQQVVFGVVLHAPEGAFAVAQADRLHLADAVAREDLRAAGHVAHFVLVDAERVEYRGLAVIHGVGAPGLGK